MSGEVADTLERQIDVQAEIGQPRLVALLFADWAGILEGNKVALGGVFDRIYLRPVTPHPPLSFYLNVKVTQAYDEDIYIHIYNPEGESMGAVISRAAENFPASPSGPNYGQVIVPLSINIQEPGIYWFEVTYRNERLGLAPLIVENAPETET
jgi:hypothetical protein